MDYQTDLVKRKISHDILTSSSVGDDYDLDEIDLDDDVILSSTMRHSKSMHDEIIELKETNEILVEEIKQSNVINFNY